MFSFLDRGHSVAGAGYNRWLVPPAALCIHLSIGQAYAWSVFNIPLTRVLGVTQSVPGDWSRESVIWIFSLAIVCLGLSAAFGGKWLEAVGPRKAMFVSALCFAVGFWLSALGWHCTPSDCCTWDMGWSVGVGWAWVTSLPSAR